MGDPLDGADGSTRPPFVLPRGVAERRGLLISKLALELVARVTPHLSALGIGGRDYMLLAVLSSAPTGSQAELAGLCSLLPAQVVPVLDELERAGLVERRRDERDRRRTIVRITELGRDKLRQADEAARRIEEQVLGPLDGELLGRLSGPLSAAGTNPR